MRSHPLLSALLVLATSAAAVAQDFDPVKSATGWGRVDIDGSCVLLAPGGQSLVTWSRDGGITGTLDISKAGLTPEKWVLDSARNAWLVAGSTLLNLDRTGKPGKRESLPADVADLAWDPKGFILTYRTTTPYVEKRDYKTGAVLWSYGSKPKKEDAAARAHHRIVVNGDGSILVASGPSLALTSLDGAKGKPAGDIVCTWNGGPSPALDLGQSDRGPMAWGLNQNAAFLAVTGSQVPASKLAGLLLARLDPAAGTVEFLPTGVTEDYLFLGIADSDAVLGNPKGGLVFVPIH